MKVIRVAVLILLFLGIYSLTICALENYCHNFFSCFYFIYEVQEGDNLTSIARKFGASISGLRWANNLGTNDFIRAGDYIRIPSQLWQEVPPLQDALFNESFHEMQLELDFYPVYLYQNLKPVSLPKDKVILYQVRRGDTLFDLARDFNTSVSFIQALNNLPDPQIRIGQRIYLPVHNLTPKEAIKKTISPAEKELLARTIHAEARGEPFIGQVAVGAVILNRVLNNSYPDTIHGVVYQPLQFSCVQDGQINLRPNETAFKAAEEALKGTDPTRGALFYYNPAIAVSTWWLETREVTVIIGNHVFAR